MICLMKLLSRFAIKLTIVLFTVLVIQFLTPVYADPIFPTPFDEISDFFRYVAIVIIAELVALLVGAEILRSLTTSVLKLKQEKVPLSRTKVYFVMLVSMLVSLFIGLVLWYLLT